MTNLKDSGLDAILSWTKSVKVFEKKLIFVPVHADGHWSLCVIVNPGLIVNTYNKDVSESEEHPLQVWRFILIT